MYLDELAHTIDHEQYAQSINMKSMISSNFNSVRTPKSLIYSNLNKKDNLNKNTFKNSQLNTRQSTKKTQSKATPVSRATGGSRSSLAAYTN